MKSDAPSLSTRTYAATALVLACLMGTAHAATPATPPAKAAAVAPKPDLVKGQAIATNVCMACHTFDGKRGAPANPILQGQHPEYLVKQLADFKAGKRKNAVMQGFAATLSEEDMRNVAAFYASKAPVPGNATSKETVALGEKIYRGGISDRAIPACAGCHSPNGAGIPSQYPRLGGQHAAYTQAQLTAYRDGGRVNTQMTGVAAKMSDKEIKAVADYIAGLR
ncbi:MAG: c-type cytochrome [Burkholderiales bacterium]